ncbi:LysR family transcriptional regulator [Vagococcus sp. BWB3-3]|uniref:LysR family transcriptional regulator n=1 Tax=Vagococcus allomyrinae TaxID=2794353 RepID=A0A940P896_9ENTE|nr:LysR family transcriptional regulator [Vagococcus allomyrinae]MBP1043192.1 LysR family transcriptional regulator [Vagococcus allomyrinae]
MNKRQLEIFIAICQTGSVTKAAATLYLTQPAVSKALADLEDTLQTKLFDRLANRLFLNQDGQRFLPKAQELVNLHAETLTLMTNPDRPRQLRLGSSITLGTDVLPEILVQMNKHHPTITLQVTVDNVDQIERKLKRNEIDVALMEGSINHPQFLAIPFSTYELDIIASSDYPKNHLTLRELIAEPLFLREKGSSLRDLFDAKLISQNLKARPRLVSVNSQVLINCVQANLGLTILPASMVASQLAQQTLKIIDVKELHLKSHNHLLLYQEKAANPALQDFLKIVLNLRK